MNARHISADGTFNLAASMAAYFGISESEVRWAFARLRALLAEGKSAAEAKRITQEEAKGKPWETK